MMDILQNASLCKSMLVLFQSTLHNEDTTYSITFDLVSTFIA